MFAEIFHYLTIPASWSSREMGYLSESIGIWARYHRCRDSWEPHLKKSRETISEYLKSHPEVRKVAFCGSGWGLDIPWESEEFKRLDQIVLIDLIHPWPIRWRVMQSPKIKRITMDLSGVVEGLNRGEFFPEPAEAKKQKYDLVISLNLLGQLPIVPLEKMEQRVGEYSAPLFHSWARLIQMRHLETLRLWAPRQIVISEFEERWIDLNGVEIERNDPWYGDRRLEPEEQWEWEIIPLGEVSDQKRKIHRVGFFV